MKKNYKNVLVKNYCFFNNFFPFPNIQISYLRESRPTGSPLVITGKHIKTEMGNKLNIKCQFQNFLSPAFES